VREIDAVGIAPLGHDVAPAHDEPRRSAARLEGTDAFTMRLARAERRALHLELIARRRRLAVHRDGDGGVDPALGEPDLLRRSRGPRAGRREVPGLRRCRRRECGERECGRDDQQSRVSDETRHGCSTDSVVRDAGNEGDSAPRARALHVIKTSSHKHGTLRQPGPFETRL
jgi:hypothetical protein